MTDPLAGFVHRFEPARGAAGATLLALHGTGGDESDLLPLARALSPDAAVLSPRGRVLEHGAPRFFRRLAEGVFDEQDLEIRTAELAEFVRAAVDRYGVAAAPVIAVGYSNGANIAASLLLREPRLLTGAVLFRAMVPFVPDRVSDLSGVRVLLASGRRDPIAPLAGAERLAALLRRGGADVTLHVDDGAHGLEGDAVAFARDWLAETLGARRAGEARGRTASQTGRS